MDCIVYGAAKSWTRLSNFHPGDQDAPWHPRDGFQSRALQWSRTENWGPAHPSQTALQDSPTQSWARATWMHTSMTEAPEIKLASAEVPGQQPTFVGGRRETLVSLAFCRGP